RRQDFTSMRLTPDTCKGGTRSPSCMKAIASIAADKRLPAIYAAREGAEAGGPMSYGANLPDLARQTAVYVDKILKGAKPADLPVAHPTKFELAINLKAARTLGLTIPRDILLIAEGVIE